MAARRPESPPRRPPAGDDDEEGSRGTDQVPIPGPPGFEDADPEAAERLRGRTAEEIYGDDDEDVSDSHVAEDPSDRRLRHQKTGRTGRANSTRVAPPPSDEPDDEAENPDATRAGPPVKLEIVAGPDEGNVKRFKGVRMVVGRVPGCDLTLTDQSVSRKHLELVVGEGGVLLRDLGSGNGTKVNGERVTERKLEHEDVISLGQTKLRFVDEGVAVQRAEQERERLAEEARLAKEAEEAKAAEEAAAAEAADAAQAEGKEPSNAGGDEEGSGATEDDAPAAEAAPAPALPFWTKDGFRALLADKRRVRNILLGAGGFVLLCLVVVFLSARHPKPEANPAYQEAKAKLEAAVEAANENRFKEAFDLLGESHKLSPQVDTHGVGTQILLDAKAQNSLALAEGAIDQKRFDDARAELARTPEASKRMNALHDRLVARLDTEQTQAQAQAVTDALAKRDFTAAEQDIELLQSPELQKTFRARLELERTRSAKEHEEEAHQAAEDHQKQLQKDAQRRKAFVEEAFNPVAKRLNELDWTRAGLECDRVQDHYEADAEIVNRAKAIKGALPPLKTNFEDGKLKMEAHAYESAVRPLHRARDLYKSLGVQSSLGRQIDDLLLAAVLDAAKTALNQDDFRGAAANFREALKINPNEPRARAGMDRLSSEADQTLQEAFADVKRDPRKAASQLKLVLEIAPPNSETHRMAKAKLRELEP